MATEARCLLRKLCLIGFFIQRMVHFHGQQDHDGLSGWQDLGVHGKGEPC